MGSGVSTSHEEYQLRSIPSVFQDYTKSSIEEGVVEKEYVEMVKKVLTWIKHLPNMDAQLRNAVVEKVKSNIVFLTKKSQCPQMAAQYHYEFSILLQVLNYLSQRPRSSQVLNKGNGSNSNKANSAQFQQLLLLGSDFMLANRQHINCPKADIERFADLFKIYFTHESIRIKDMNRLCSLLGPSLKKLPTNPTPQVPPTNPLVNKL